MVFAAWYECYYLAQVICKSATYAATDPQLSMMSVISAGGSKSTAISICTATAGNICSSGVVNVSAASATGPE